MIFDYYMFHYIHLNSFVINLKCLVYLFFFLIKKNKTTKKKNTYSICSTRLTSRDGQNTSIFEKHRCFRSIY
jgi:hypothetical protein